eukprot:Pgem_evm1s16323
MALGIQIKTDAGNDNNEISSTNGSASNSAGNSAPGSKRGSVCEELTLTTTTKSDA